MSGGSDPLWAYPILVRGGYHNRAYSRYFNRKFSHDSVFTVRRNAHLLAAPLDCSQQSGTLHTL